MFESAEAANAQRIEMILRQVESLPTLPGIATRLLSLSSAEDSDIREIVSLVEADPSLTSRLLSMCRRSDKGISHEITTVDRAIVLLGFDAVRSALLSVHIFELFRNQAASSEEDQVGDDAPPVNRAGLWRHMLGVACASEMIVHAHTERRVRVSEEDAFVCGLLHDLGKIALDSILPRSYRRVAHIAHKRQTNIAQVERTVIGVDHHRAGKRLAEHWGLPHMLQDVMWLHNQPFATIPDVPHRNAIGVISVADALTRTLHIGWSGNEANVPDAARLADDCGLDPRCLSEISSRLFDRVEERASDLGLDEVVGPELQMQAIAEANRRLGALNASLQRRASESAEQSAILRAIAAFPGARSGGVISAFSEVVRSAASIFGDGFYAIVHQSRPGSAWQVCQIDATGRLVRSQIVDPPVGEANLSELADLRELRASAASLIPWLMDYLGDADDVRSVRLLPLAHADGAPAILLHDRDLPRSLLRSDALPALTSLWAFAVSAAAQHDGARRLGEQLAEANRELSDTQAQLTETRSMARLGALAAGAAHEMNNPLAIISGRSQILAERSRDASLRNSAQAIREAAGRLSDLISGLHVFADPPAPNLQPTDLTDLLTRAVRDLKLERHQRRLTVAPVKLQMDGKVPPIRVDAAQIAAAVTELLKNAMEASPKEMIRLRVQVDDHDGRLMIEVEDDGRGMSERTLEHAFDPFFSEKVAGRQPGLGLAKARRLVELHGGRIELDSAPGSGTTARIVLPADEHRDQALEAA